LGTCPLDPDFIPIPSLWPISGGEMDGRQLSLRAVKPPAAAGGSPPHGHLPPPSPSFGSHALSTCPLSDLYAFGMLTSHSVQAPIPHPLWGCWRRSCWTRCDVSGGRSPLGEGGHHGRSPSRDASRVLLSLLSGSQKSGSQMRPILDLCILNKSVAMRKFMMLTGRALL